jgi:hypothetical protein
MNTEFKLKQDKYREARGGYSRLLKVTCEYCGGLVCVYQKDGPGPLKRMYLDRILKVYADAKAKLICKKCKSWLGIKSKYAKENRPCYILFESVIKKKVVKMVS